MFLADNNCLWHLSQAIDKYVRVRRDDQLRAMGGFNQQVREFAQQIWMQAQFRFFQAD
jgi:hypothetical protein